MQSPVNVRQLVCTVAELSEKVREHAAFIQLFQYAFINLVFD